MNEHDEDPGPVPGLRGYRLDQAPERDLWPGIEARLAPRRSRWVAVSRYAIAASLVAGLALTLASRMQADAPAPGGTVVASAAPAAVRAPLPVQGTDRALVHANLAIVDSAEQQLRHALEQDPDSRSLQRLLTATQEQRRDLRRRLSA